MGRRQLNNAIECLCLLALSGWNNYSYRQSYRQYYRLTYSNSDFICQKMSGYVGFNELAR